MKTADIVLANSILTALRALPLTDIQLNTDRVTVFTLAHSSQLNTFIAGLARAGLCTRDGKFGDGKGLVGLNLYQRLIVLARIDSGVLAKLCKVVFDFLILRKTSERAANELIGPIGRERAEGLQTKCVPACIRAFIITWLCRCTYPL
jgi:hypothetical protein